MTICKYYLQGNCRFGNKCWNEHIDRSSGHHERSSPVRHYEDDTPAQYHDNDYYGYYNRYSYQNPRYSPPPSRSPFSSTLQRSNSGAHSSPQGSSFSFTKAYEEVTSQENNRFAVLNDQTVNEKKTVKEVKNDEIDILKDDMTRWELGKQWPFSCYAPFKTCFPGFEDISPEELRWEYYHSKDSGTLNIHLQHVTEHAEKMSLKRNEIKSATPQILVKLKSLQSNPMQQSSIFGNVQSNISSSNILGSKTVFGTEKAPQQNSRDPSTFRFSLSNVSEQSKPLFRLPQFGTQNSQINILGSNEQSTAMETSMLDSKDSESGKSLLFSTGKQFTPSPAQQKHSDSHNIGTSTGLSNIDSNKLDQTSNVTEFIYTELKLLGKLEKEQYTSNAETFVLGKIPSQPPPKEFCF